MRADAVLCARGFSIDRDSGSLSIFQIIDGMEASGFPVLLQNLSIVALLERTADEPATVRCVLQVLLDENLLLNEQMDINFGMALRHRQAINLQNVVVQAAGTVSVKVRYNNADLGVYRFPVTPARAPAAPQ